MPQYRLDDGDAWILHNELEQVYGGIVLQPPPDVFDAPDYKIVKALPDRVYYSGFPLAEKTSAVLPPTPALQHPPAAPVQLPPPVQQPLPPPPVQQQQPLAGKRVCNQTRLYNPTTGNGLILKPY